MKFAKCLRRPFFIEHLRWLPLTGSQKMAAADPKDMLSERNYQENDKDGPHKVKLFASH